jgi:predicted ATP-grasp superfamily ATP-dependent carboligase
MRILVTDAEHRPALAVVRSLGRAGHHIVTCSSVPRPLAAASRYSAEHRFAANPLVDAQRFVVDVLAIAEDAHLDAIFPVTEQAHIAILAERERFSAYCIPAPDAATFAGVADKEHVLAAAADLGIATPRQVRLSAAFDDRELPDDLPFPVVIKPARSVVDGAKHVVRYARDASELTSQLAALPAAAFPVLVQQRVVGPGVGIFLLRWDDRVLATFSHRRLRENPPSGGGSVYCESIAVDAELLRQATRLLEHFAWRGLAMVEFKIDRATGTAYLMEINGRVWGSLQLAIDAGVDFPALLIDAACRGVTAEPTPYRVGVRLRSWWPDVDHFLARVRHSSDRLSLPPDAPERSAAVRDFLRWRQVDRLDTLRLNDPAPFFRDSWDWIRRRLGR